MSDGEWVTETREVCAKCGQQRGLFHKDCDGEFATVSRKVTPWGHNAATSRSKETP